MGTGNKQYTNDGLTFKANYTGDYAFSNLMEFRTATYIATAVANIKVINRVQYITGDTHVHWPHTLLHSVQLR